MADTHGTRSATVTHGTAGSVGAAGANDRSQHTDQHENWLLGRVRESAASGIESQKKRATDGLGTIAQAVRTTTDQLRTQHHDSIAEYVQQAADQIDRVAEQLKNKDVRELVEDAQRLARRNPAAFAGTAFALGLVTARFLKSSHENGSEEHGYGGYPQERGWSRDSQWPGERYGATGHAAPTERSSSYTPPHGEAIASSGTAGERTRAKASTSAAATPPTTATSTTASTSSSTDALAGQKGARPGQGRETERS